MLNDKSTRVRPLNEGVGPLRLPDGRDDFPEYLISAADRDGAFDLKIERPSCPCVIEPDDDVIHRMAVTLPLNGDVGEDSRLACRALAA
jgi:hypothetical protein